MKMIRITLIIIGIMIGSVLQGIMFFWEEIPPHLFSLAKRMLKLRCRIAHLGKQVGYECPKIYQDHQ